MSVRWFVVWASLVLTLVAAPAFGDRIVLKDGRVIEGEATVDEKAGKVHLTRAGATMSFELSDVVEIVEEDSSIQACVIPIQGPFTHLRTAKELASTLKLAIAAKPKLIIYVVNSPGGRIDVARALVRLNLQVPKGIKTIAYVSGNHRGAHSAAAYFSTSCDLILMAPGQAIGAAVAFQPTASGPKAVNEKFQSAWRAEIRATAEAKGHPPAVALAMVDVTVGAAEIKLGGEQRFVSARSLKSLAERAKATKVSFELVRVICEPGQVLTLTSKEAVRAHLARAVVPDLAGILRHYKVDAQKVKRFEDPLVEAGKAYRQAKKTLEKDTKELQKLFAQIQRVDPRAQRYMIDPQTHAFTDSGAAWRKATGKSQRLVKRALSRLDQIDSKRKRHPDLSLDVTEITSLRTDLQTYSEKLKAEKWLKVLPAR
ncbi:MAG: hypothetical protein JKY65_24860 [Planctomycetes bacterium]|nr:hypothetical protein [Planctomycetota bacterium]